MPTDMLDQAVRISQVIGNVLVLGVLIAALKQIKEAKRQADAAQKEALAATRAGRIAVSEFSVSGYMELVRYLQADDAVKARGAIFAARGGSAALDPNAINGDDQLLEAAELVCKTYETLGALLKRKYLPLDILVEHWGDSIIKSWDALKPWAEASASRIGNPQRWSGFRWLAAEVGTLRVRNQALLAVLTHEQADAFQH